MCVCRITRKSYLLTYLLTYIIIFSHFIITLSPCFSRNAASASGPTECASGPDVVHTRSEHGQLIVRVWSTELSWVSRTHVKSCGNFHGIPTTIPMEIPTGILINESALSGADPGICKRGGGGPSLSLSFPFPYSFPLSLPSPLELVPLKPARESGGAP